MIKNKKHLKILVKDYLDKGFSASEMVKELDTDKSTIDSIVKDIVDDANIKNKVMVDELKQALIKRAKGYDYNEVRTEIKKDGAGIVFMKVGIQIKKHVPADPIILKELIEEYGQDIIPDKKYNGGEIKVKVIELD